MPSPEASRAAEFAATFSDTTNLAQRRRYQETLQDFDAEQRAEGKAQYETQLSRAAMRDPLKYEGLRIDQQREGRMEREFTAREGRFTRQDEIAKTRFERTQKLNEEKFALDQEKFDDQHELKLIEIEDARKVVADTRALRKAEAELRKLALFPGTEEYAQRLGEVISKTPYADPNVRKALLSQANIEVDEQELGEIYQKAVEGKLGRTFLTVGPDGKRTWRFTPPKEEPSLDKQRHELESRYKNLITTAKEAGIVDGPEAAAYYKEQAKEVMGRLKTLGQKDQPSGSPAAPSSTPKSGKPYTVDGKAIKFDTSNILESVQGALNDGVISEEQARKTLESAGYKRKGQQ